MPLSWKVYHHYKLQQQQITTAGPQTPTVSGLSDTTQNEYVPQEIISTTESLTPQYFVPTKLQAKFLDILNGVKTMEIHERPKARKHRDISREQMSQLDHVIDATINICEYDAKLLSDVVYSAQMALCNSRGRMNRMAPSIADKTLRRLRSDLSKVCNELKRIKDNIRNRSRKETRFKYEIFGRYHMKSWNVRSLEKLRTYLRQGVKAEGIKLLAEKKNT